MASVLTVGITVLDSVYAVDQLPRGDSKHYARARSEVIGGIAANAAIAIARLGGRAVLASRVGNDLAAERIVAELSAAAVDTTHLDWLNGVATSTSAIIVAADGARLLVNHADDALFRGAADFSKLTVDAVMTDTRWPGGARAALDLAHQRQIPSIVDFDRMPEASVAETLLNGASHIAFGEQGLRGLTGIDEIGDALIAASRRSKAWLCATAGSEGAYWLDGGQVRHLPAFPVEAVDTLAAGDAFHGALALALAERQDTAAALRFASAVAAIKCTRFGGGKGLPDRAEVEKFLGEHKV